MNWEQLRKYKYPVGVVSITIALVVYKFRFLSLPYFWDEAWPYSIGVHNMYDNGLSLMPGAISLFVARGHPLMFHFLAAGWMKIFGTGLFSGHCFAMLISILLIITIYLFCKTFFSERVGFIACLLFSSQAIFISQSVFLMPEVLMALWTMLCFLAFFKKKYFLFVIFGTAMLLTKESGGVFFIALFASVLLFFVRSDKKSVAGLLKQLSLISAPVLLASVYFIIQKIKCGWFLYPFYMDYLSSWWRSALGNIPSATAYTFIYYGRNGFSLFIIISLVVLLMYRKAAFMKSERKILLTLTVFIVFYLLFSAVNYYIPRYLMCVFPPFYIAGAVLLDKAYGRMKIVFPLIVSGLFITSIFYYVHTTGSGDADYSPFINTDLQMVRFCEKQQLYDKHIFAVTLLRSDFSEPYEGYLSGKKFSNMEWEYSDKTEYFIFSSDENNNVLFDKIKKENRLELVKRFEEKYAWCEIYKVVR